MKKLLFVVTACLGMAITAQTTQAQVRANQRGDMAVGVNFNYGFAYSGSYNNAGIGAKFQYSFTDHIRVEPIFTYYFKKDNLSIWDLIANVHYVFPLLNNHLNLYPLAGLGIMGAKVSETNYSNSTTKFAANLGGGAEYKFTSHFAVGAELKYQMVSSYGHFIVQAGLTYRF